MSIQRICNRFHEKETELKMRSKDANELVDIDKPFTSQPSSTPHAMEKQLFIAISSTFSAISSCGPSLF